MRTTVSGTVRGKPLQWRRRIAMRKRYICLLLLLLMTFSGCRAESLTEKQNESPEDALTAIALPIDFTGGSVGAEEGYLTEMSYQDPTIRVEITENDGSAYISSYKGRDVTYWVADIRIGDASQLRTAPAVSFDKNSAAPIDRIAERVNAILAINGDFTTRLNDGIIIRQGITYRNKLKSRRDVLLIDDDGDFHAYHLPEDGEIEDTVDGKQVINAFYFGPILVEDGEIPDPLPSFTFLKPEKYYARIAICQVEKLHYKIILTTTEQGYTMGLKLEDFAQLCKDEGAQIAYNLDGGLSTSLYFQHRRINGQHKVNFRDIPDIIYFASAWNGGDGE